MTDVAVSTLNVLSVCTGGGGLDLGFRLAIPAARVVCYVEREVTAAALLVAHMQTGALDDAPLWTDLRTFDGRPWRGLVDVVIGGIPCQPWSVAGKRRGAADERNLWPDTLRVIRECEPRVVFIENVAGILRDGYHGFIKPDLERAGYRVEAGIFTAAEVGTPHRRERLFILAVGQSDSEGRSTSTAMGDSERRRCRERTDTPEPERETQGWRQAVTGGRGTVGDTEGPETMADPIRERGCCGNGQRTYAKDAHPTSQWLPAFPPGPDERERWAEILARYPEFAPATQSPVRDLADGLASGLVRRDQLSILGNGVVPQCAVYAFRVLYDRLRLNAKGDRQCLTRS